jgi:hypothetical protein
MAKAAYIHLLAIFFVSECFCHSLATEGRAIAFVRKRPFSSLLGPVGGGLAETAAREAGRRHANQGGGLPRRCSSRKHRKQCRIRPGRRGGPAAEHLAMIDLNIRLLMELALAFDAGRGRSSGRPGRLTRCASVFNGWSGTARGCSPRSAMISGRRLRFATSGFLGRDRSGRTYNGWWRRGDGGGRARDGRLSRRLLRNRSR